MAVFGLIHGASHGAWQWGATIAELEALGHESICVDLPVDDPAVGLADYAALAAAAFDNRDDLVVVGHSLGGYVAQHVVEVIGARVLVFLCGAIQEGSFLGLPPASEMLLIPQEELRVADDGCIRLAAATAERYFFHDLGPCSRRWAIERLRPQAAAGVVSERVPKIDPTIPLASIICSEDRAISPEWSRAAARESLKVDPIEIPGSHSPFLAHPARLAAALDRAARVAV
jgi:pimeloyl-ACP methyl ester carboxylesterase